nr:hypothetical protein [Comamonas koreensis]
MDKFINWLAGKTLVILIIPACFVLVLTVMVPVFSNDFKITYETNGALGDFFGGIMNPIIALMALIWLVKGVSLQQKELNETKIALQSSERHQAAQVKIAATTALIAANSNEHDKLKNYLQVLEAELNERLKEHDEQQYQMESYQTLSLDLETQELINEVDVLNVAIKNFDDQRNNYIFELKRILDNSGAVSS